MFQFHAKNTRAIELLLKDKTKVSQMKSAVRQPLGLAVEKEEPLKIELKVVQSRDVVVDPFRKT